jgi:hypothetical protein
VSHGFLARFGISASEVSSVRATVVGERIAITWSSDEGRFER